MQHEGKHTCWKLQFGKVHGGKKKTFGRLMQKFWTKTEIDLKCKG